MKDILQKINQDVHLFVDEQMDRNKNIERVFKKYSGENFASLNTIKSKIKNGEINNVVLAGMGSSMYALREIENRYIENSIKVQTLEASKASKYADKLIDDSTLLVVVSQSGTSPEVISLQSKLSNTANVISITNNKGSNMKNFEPVFEIYSDKEYYIAHNSYLNTLLVLDWITNYIFKIDVKYTLEELKELLKIQERYVENNFSEGETLLDDIECIDIITEEDSVGTGLNTSLLFREGLGIMANTFTVNEYYHGEHLVNNKNKLTVFLDVKSSKEDTNYMKDIEKENNNKYIFIEYNKMFNEDDYEKYLLLKPVIQMSLFNRIVFHQMRNLS